MTPYKLRNSNTNLCGGTILFLLHKDKWHEKRIIGKFKQIFKHKHPQWYEYFRENPNHHRKHCSIFYQVFFQG